MLRVCTSLGFALVYSWSHGSDSVPLCVDDHLSSSQHFWNHSSLLYSLMALLPCAGLRRGPSLRHHFREEGKDKKMPGCEDGRLWAEEGRGNQAPHWQNHRPISPIRCIPTLSSGVGVHSIRKQPSLAMQAGLEEVPISWDKELGEKKHFYLLKNAYWPFKSSLLVSISPLGRHSRSTWQLSVGTA